MLQQRHSTIKVPKRRVSAGDRLLFARKSPGVFFDTLQNRISIGLHVITTSEPRLDLHQGVGKEKAVVASSPDRLEFLFGLNKQWLRFDVVTFRDVQIAEHCIADRNK